MKTTSNGKQPSIEDDLRIVKVEYLSNHLMDHTQILNLSFMTKPYFVNPLNEEDDLKISKVKYLKFKLKLI